MRVPLLLIATLSMAAPALADPPVPAPGTGAPAKPVKEKKICRYMTPTGSIMEKRVCATAAEWAAFYKSTGEGVDAFRGRPISRGSITEN